MTNIQELEVEFEGMLGTIKQYSCDPYVVSYLERLRVAIQNKEIKMIGIMIAKLNEWYEDNMMDIESNRWVINLNSHHKTQRLIKEFMFKFKS